MKTRTIVIIVVAVLSVLALSTATGAFSTSPDRGFTVTTVSDDQAYLELAPHSGPNGDYAQLNGGQLEITFANVAADGVTQNATTTLIDVFNVTNAGTQPVTVTISESGPNTGVVRFETASGTQLDGGSAGETIAVGETIEVTIESDTTGGGLGGGTSLVDSITIYAES